MGYLLISGEAPRRSGLESFDTLGALLGHRRDAAAHLRTGQGARHGWGPAQAIGELAGAAVPLSIFTTKGLAATDAGNV